MQMLLGKDADVLSTNSLQQGPLHYAAAKGKKVSLIPIISPTVSLIMSPEP